MATELLEGVTLLPELTRTLANLRRMRDEQVKALAEKKAWFEAENAGLIEAAKIATESVALAEAALRDAALDRYKTDGNNAPTPGVSIKVFEVQQYDAAQAFAWAKAHNLALVPESLDKKSFEKIAKASQIDFVEFTSDPRVTIATDLNKVFNIQAAEVAS